MRALSFAAVLVLATVPGARADDTWDYAVQVSSTIRSSPPQITLNWLPDLNGGVLSYTVYRKAMGANAWGTGTTLPATATTHVDLDVVVGRTYEYKIVKAKTAYSGYGYISTGIEVPEVEKRGTVVLVVDNTYAAPLADGLTRLRQDLIGDGWTVIRHDVARTDPVATVRRLIQADYAADPVGVNTVFLFGRVPVPYSGLLNPDGHGEHLGAWPADVYYGEMNGAWTDSTVQYLQRSNGDAADSARLTNVPGDGKFDATNIPGLVELQVGRVDLANLPGRKNASGPATLPDDLALLRQYLDKDHNFRQRRFSLQRRAIVGDYFGVYNGEAFAASGYRSFAPLVGADRILNLNRAYGGATGVWMSTLRKDDYLWAYGCGAGSYTTASGLGTGTIPTAPELVENDIRAVFVMLLGSWFGDWDSQDNLLRSVLATPTYGLTAVWSGRPHWFVHPMGQGETIGYCTRLTQNNAGLYQNSVNFGTAAVHIALMGDPTLRLHPVGPPSVVRGTAGSRDLTLNWTASADSVLGYHVYRGPSADGPFVRLNTSLVTGTSFQDPQSVAPGTTYMVRALKLETTPSGSYYNLSQGAFFTGDFPVFIAQPVSQTVAPGGSVTFTAATSLPANLQWRKDGRNIPGATATSLTLPKLSPADSGTYTVVAERVGSTTISAEATLLVDPPRPGRLMSLSARGQAGTGSRILTAGFVLSAGGGSPILVRGVGPGLTGLGVSNVLGDPRLRVMRGGIVIAENEDWGDGNAPVIVETAARVGAFGLPPGSRDAALLGNMSGGTPFTVQVASPVGSTGVALAELYDASRPEDVGASRLLNLSCSALVGTDANVLIAGFVLSGNTPRRLLIRGVGPTLATLQVDGVLADPVLEIHAKSGAQDTIVARNDNWMDAPNDPRQMADAFAAAGAFLFSAGSRDAAVIVTLSPGSYTAVISGVERTTGVALVEVYELP